MCKKCYAFTFKNDLCKFHYFESKNATKLRNNIIIHNA